MGAFDRWDRVTPGDPKSRASRGGQRDATLAGVPPRVAAARGHRPHRRWGRPRDQHTDAVHQRRGPLRQGRGGRSVGAAAPAFCGPRRAARRGAGLRGPRGCRRRHGARTAGARDTRVSMWFVSVAEISTGRKIGYTPETTFIPRLSEKSSFSSKWPRQDRGSRYDAAIRQQPGREPEDAQAQEARARQVWWAARPRHLLLTLVVGIGAVVGTGHVGACGSSVKPDTKCDDCADLGKAVWLCTTGANIYKGIVCMPPNSIGTDVSARRRD